MSKSGSINRWWLNPGYEAARCEALREDQYHPGQCKNHVKHEGLCKAHYRVLREGRTVKRVSR